jgi:hypothetical protein
VVWPEQDGRCPYSGKSLSCADALSAEATEIDHIFPSGLSLCFRRDQHVVGDRLDGGSDAQQCAEAGMGRFAPVEAEDEFVEVGLEMLAA